MQQNNHVPLQNGQIAADDLCTLDPQEKKALELLYLKGRTCAETAAELNLSVEQLKEVLKKAFTHLKAEQS